MPEQAANLDRSQEAGHMQYFSDYFHPVPVMSRNLFGTIIEGVRYHDPNFKCKLDTTGELIFSSYQKCSTNACLWSCW
jgi:hypothetical protein